MNVLRTGRSASKLTGFLNCASKRTFCCACLHIKGLPWDITEDKLFTHFNQFGSINHIGLPKYPDGRHKGYAFVSYSVGERPLPGSYEASYQQFPSEQEFKQMESILSSAISGTDKQELWGRTVYAGMSSKTKRARVHYTPVDTNNIPADDLEQ
ncbi:hypothetical protein AX774_g61 [Zancudomyces culisetae]|uniref:RRM domain-containing protein n=1 Tax=Zancudomyces culisetae TaxID=1213189 RepID=A0A1R1PZK4_ZANCU|nr:hypothetical protein AX774_g61 [Zancudomyces culisetae]|eukprot:OMH86375.1 hypothetical protein AX774_g61 [Zancudomyces culisetae]